MIWKCKIICIWTRNTINSSSHYGSDLLSCNSIYSSSHSGRMWHKVDLKLGAQERPTKIAKNYPPPKPTWRRYYTNLTSLRCCHRVWIPETRCLLSHCFSKCLKIFHMKFVYMYARKWHFYTHVSSHTFCILSLYFDQAIKYVPAKCTCLFVNSFLHFLFEET